MGAHVLLPLAVLLTVLAALVKQPQAAGTGSANVAPAVQGAARGRVPLWQGGVNTGIDGIHAISIYPNEKPAEVAAAFQVTHGLDEKSAAELTSKLRLKIQDFVCERARPRLSPRCELERRWTATHREGCCSTGV